MKRTLAFAQAALTLALCLVGSAASARADLTPQQVNAGKAATALVSIPGADNRRSYGTAFCVDPAGVFVTNAHVVEAAGAGGRIDLVLQPGEKEQRVVEAKVMRVDKGLDLAALRVDNVGELTALELGDVAALYDTVPVTAFGYPFGGELVFEKSDFPSVSVNSGRVTSLRKKRGELEAIQLDAAVNPGNSGGPVLDPSGKVVGVVRAGVRGSGVNFAVPASHVLRFLSKPELSVSPAAVPFAKRFEERPFVVKLMSLARPRPDYAVELTLGTGPAARTLKLEPTTRGGDTFAARAAAVPARTGPRQLQVTAQFSGGSLAGRVSDQPARVANQALSLGDVRRVNGGEKPTVQMVDGKELAGTLGGLEAVRVGFGEVEAVVDLSKASSLAFEDLEKPTKSVEYRAVAKVDGQTVAQSTGSLELSDVPEAPKAATATASRDGGEGVKIAPLAQNLVRLKLPAPLDDVVAGGGGRYLILHLKKLRKLAVFDVNEAEVTRFLSLGSDDVLYAATADKLLIVLRDQNILQRWDLKTLTRELTVPLPEVGQLDAMLCGYASAGPVMLMTRTGPKFLDPATLKLTDVKGDQQGGGYGFGMGNWSPHPQYPLAVRVSGDGTTFAAWEPGLSPSGVRVLVVDGNAARGRYEHNSAGVLLPDYDGSLIFTSNGIYAADLKQLAPEQFRGIQCLPSYHPSYFLGYSNGADPYGGNQQQAKPKLSIYSTSDRRLLVSLTDLDELTPAAGNTFVNNSGPALTLEKRIHLMPAAELLVTVPDARDELILRRFRMTDALEKAGIDYLFVTSMPPRSVKPGESVSYAIEVKSKKGGVQMKLESGPDGMTLSKSGQLQWQVPADHKAGEVGVIVLVRDASGQEVYHTFNLQIRAPKASGAP